jgi:hypothetical protein
MWSLRNKAMAHTAGREYTEIAETKLKKSYRKAKEFLKGWLRSSPYKDKKIAASRLEHDNFHFSPPMLHPA